MRLCWLTAQTHLLELARNVVHSHVALILVVVCDLRSESQDEHRGESGRRRSRAHVRFQQTDAT